VPQFDDANRRVSYRYTVTEGPQYRMGTVEIKGLPPAITEKLNASWQLQPGEVFDSSYYDRFLKKAAMDLAASGLNVTQSAASFKPNRDNLTVNVVIEFK
jgi:outer membrane protein assembly factor BamA